MLNREENLRQRQPCIPVDLFRVLAAAPFTTLRAAQGPRGSEVTRDRPGSHAAPRVSERRAQPRPAVSGAVAGAVRGALRSPSRWILATTPSESLSPHPAGGGKGGTLQGHA